MWETGSGQVIKKLEAHDDPDVATPWAEFACEDKVVVGLTIDEHLQENTPLLYKYQVKVT